MIHLLYLVVVFLYWEPNHWILNVMSQLDQKFTIVYSFTAKNLDAFFGYPHAKRTKASFDRLIILKIDIMSTEKNRIFLFFRQRPLILDASAKVCCFVSMLYIESYRFIDSNCGLFVEMHRRKK